MGFFKHPLLRSRFVPLTVALLAALWLALPALKALAVPPDTGPIQGSATAVQDPPGSCPAQADTIPFAAVISIQNGILLITDPAGGASGPINSDGTAQLTGPQETYDLLSSQGTTLNLREVYAGCQFRTTIVLDRVLFQVQTSETESQPTVPGTPAVVTVPETGGGQSLAWLWGAGAVVSVGVLGGGLWLVFRQPVTITDVAPDCSKERDRVRRAFEAARPFLEAEDALESKQEALARSAGDLQEALGREASTWNRRTQRYDADRLANTERAERDVRQAEAAVDLAKQHVNEFDDEREELDEALYALAKCLGEPDARSNYANPAARRSTLIRLGLLPPPGPRFDPVPPSEGGSEEGDDRQEIG